MVKAIAHEPPGECHEDAERPATTDRGEISLLVMTWPPPVPGELSPRDQLGAGANAAVNRGSSPRSRATTIEVRVLDGERWAYVQRA
jgi:hypothetical protein